MSREDIKKLILALCKPHISSNDRPPPPEHCLTAAEKYLNDLLAPKIEDIEFVSNFVDVSNVNYVNCYIIIQLFYIYLLFL